MKIQTSSVTLLHSPEAKTEVLLTIPATTSEILFLLEKIQEE